MQIIEIIGIYGFGRTDKALPINSPVVVGGVVQPGTGTNPRARYALHFHHMGVDPRVAPARGTSAASWTAARAGVMSTTAAMW